MSKRFVKGAGFLLFLLLAPAAALPAATQNAAGANPALQEANALYAAQKWAEAAKAYEKLSQENPSNGLVWFRLGSSLHSLKQYERAVDAFRRSAEIGKNPTAMYNAACGYALLGRKEEAFEWLFKSLKAGLIPNGPLASDADLASLLADARFKEATELADKNAQPCMFAPERRQFDFWVGDWNVYNPQGALVGTNNIQNVTGGCIIFENWTARGGGTGKSMNFYDPGRGKWRQVWVGFRGGVLEYEGEYKDGAMRFGWETTNPDGSKGLQKLTFTALGPDRVRQVFESSTDGGKTWSVTFDGLYVRKGSEGAKPAGGN